MKARGFRVFAVTFAHNQDDNFFWAEQVANAIRRVRELTGAAKVDLLGHSKGGVPVRCYVSGFREAWMTPYRGDVRRLILVAAPNGGIDFTFRHPACNFLLHEGGNSHRLNAPMSWDRIRRFGSMHDCRSLGPGKEGPDYWPGQRQLLARWDRVYPLPSLEFDSRSTYEGGRGLVSESRGIDHFIAEGDFFMERLAKRPVCSKVEVVVLAGNRPDIRGILNEKTGPSDGILFVESALALPEATVIVAEEVMSLNHITLLADRRGKEWLCGVLKSAERHPLSREELNEVRMRGLGVKMGPDEVLPPSPGCPVVEGDDTGSPGYEDPVLQELSAGKWEQPEVSYEIRDLPVLDLEMLPELRGRGDTAVPLL
jgi:pimeloyl-ACP methyl ester carboxylesterase